MLKSFIEGVIARHHYWRDKEIDEITELYWSQFLRSLSLGLVNIFVPVFLYKLGYSIPDIFWYFAWWFALRPVLDIFAGLTIARIGPKHTMVVATLFQLVYLALLLSLGAFGWPLWIVAVVGGLAYGLFTLALNIDFSKVKHDGHVGKELGVAGIFVRFGSFLGPLIGGITAGIFGPQYTIILAIVVLISSLIPIFLSGEAVRVRQKLRFEEFDWRLYKRDILSVSMLLTETTIGLFLWPLFVGVYIFTSNTYLLLGVVTAAGTILSMFSAYYFGKRTDNGHGRTQLRVSVYASSLLHLLRPFAQNIGHVTAINVVNEPLVTAFHIPFVKGLFDRAGSLPGQRIVYLTVINSASTAARFSFWLLLWLLSQFLDPLVVIKLAFVVGALIVLGITLERFPSLDKNQSSE